MRSSVKLSGFAWHALPSKKWSVSSRSNAERKNELPLKRKLAAQRKQSVGAEHDARRRSSEKRRSSSAGSKR